MTKYQTNINLLLISANFLAEKTMKMKKIGARRNFERPVCVLQTLYTREKA